ncbi:MAG: hypothetical protein Q7T97_02270 [Burkholderiaceae bacterium]|nr:hypothetical protein [Burkholderiaceae bacterium]
MKYQFYFLDPVASFSKGSKGKRSRRILSNGEESKLGLDAWKVGLSAYERLSTACGHEATMADLKMFVEMTLPFIEEFFTDLNGAIRTERITLIHPETGKSQKKPIDWKACSWNWQMRTMLNCIVELAAANEASEMLEKLGNFFAIAALSELDAAVLASKEHCVEEALESVTNATRLMNQVDAAGRVEKAAKAMQIKMDSQRASNRAKVRHAKDPRRLARDFVYQCWLDWQAKPSQYPSAAAFARSMLDKEPDTLKSEVVISRWVRGWAKESK